MPLHPLVANATNIYGIVHRLAAGEPLTVYFVPGTLRVSHAHIGRDDVLIRYPGAWASCPLLEIPRPNRDSVALARLSPVGEYVARHDRYPPDWDDMEPALQRTHRSHWAISRRRVLDPDYKRRHNEQRRRAAARYKRRIQDFQRNALA